MNDMQKHKCVWCAEIAGSRRTNFAGLFPKIRDRFALKSDAYIVMPCLGQLTPFHSLLIPREHTCTMAESVSEYAENIEHIIQRFYDVVRDLSGCDDLLMFEHGARSKFDGGCGIYHSHLHLVPIEKKFPIWSLFPAVQSEQIRTLPKSLETAALVRPYVLIGSLNKGCRIKSLNGPLPSQLLRRRLAKLLSIPQWNWRDYGAQESVPEFLELFGTQKLNCLEQARTKTL